MTTVLTADRAERVRARIRLWCREVTDKMILAELNRDYLEFTRLRRRWILLQRVMFMD